MDLNQMMIFAKVSELQSFTKAGKVLGIEKSNVSLKVSNLEKRLGVRLLNRTTRSVTLTEAGRGYYQYCLEILQKAEEADAFAESLNSEPKGTLRITAAVDMGPMIVKSLLKPFLERYQHIKVDLLLTNRRVDLIRERFDLAIRAGLLQQEDSSYISRQLVRSQNGLYAAPDFLKQLGKPVTLEDLDELLVIGFATEEAFDHRTKIKAKLGKKTIQFTPNCRLKLNDMASYIESAVQGLGVAVLPSYFVQKHVKKKSLIPLLPELEFPEVGFFALYPSRLLKSAKLKVFLEHLKTWEPTL